MSTPLYAQSAGNINTASMWNTAADGSGADVPFASVDINYSLDTNGNDITVNVDVTCDFITNNTSGSFQVTADGITITANAVAVADKILEITLTNAAHDFTIVGNVSAGTSASSYGLRMIGPGTAYIEGNVTSGSGSNSYGAALDAAGNIDITGNVLGGTNNYCVGVQIESTSSGNVTIVGTVTGNSGTYSHGVYSEASASGDVNITGDIQSGLGTGVAGVDFRGDGTLTVTGDIASDNTHSAVDQVGGNLVVNGNLLGGTGSGKAVDFSGDIATINGNVTANATSTPLILSGGTTTITGNVTSGAGTQKYGITASGTTNCIVEGNVEPADSNNIQHHAINWTSTGTLTVEGTVTGGNQGSNVYGINLDDGVCVVAGTMVGGDKWPAIFVLNNDGLIRITGICDFTGAAPPWNNINGSSLNFLQWVSESDASYAEFPDDDGGTTQLTAGSGGGGGGLNQGIQAIESGINI